MIWPSSTISWWLARTRTYSGIVVVDRSTLKLAGDCARVPHAEIDAAGHHHLGQPLTADPLEALGAAIVNPAHQGIVDLVGGEVDDADELIGGRQLLHGRSADAVGVEDHGLEAGLREVLLGGHHRMGGVAKHGHGHEAIAGRYRGQPVAVLEHTCQAAATLSKMVQAMGLSPRMSTTEWTTIMSLVPTSGSK